MASIATKLSPDQADLLEQALQSEPWLLLTQLIEDRVADKVRELESGKLLHEDYIRICAAIREARYLRDRPAQLIRDARESYL